MIKTESNNFRWIKSYDWLIEFLSKVLCISDYEQEELNKWVNEVGSKQVCEVIISLFGYKYITKDLQKQFSISI